MIPLHFGSRHRLLFGAYSPAVGSKRRRGVVLCNPWGVEALRAHRSLHHLGRILSGSGFDVFRFDYFGTGDSWGDAADVSLGGCVDDAHAAVEELRDVGGLERVDLVGLRFGTQVAARAAAEGGEGARVVLWEPVFEGAELLRELACRAGDAREVEGFPLPDRLREELARATLWGLPGAGFRVLVAASTPVAEEAAALLAAAELSVRVVPGRKCWEQEGDFGAGAVPAILLSGIAEWLS
jgi:pimeloyl-ACP methyl ester carboxylesterase